MVLHSLVTRSFTQSMLDPPNVQLRASESPPATIPANVLVTPFRLDIVIHNTITSSSTLFELTCPLDSNLTGLIS